MPLKPAASETGDPLLLTPGPLTTGKRVKEVMVHDWGSRDAAFLAINSEVLARLPEVVNGGADYVTVPMQGSGTFAVEAMLTTFVPADGHVLLLVNGAYGALAQKYGKFYLSEWRSAFGALPLDAQASKPDAIAASSNKCIEGVPGLGFVVARRAALEQTQGNATTLVLDLHDQWKNFEKTGQYRFTPPIHVIVSFHQALTEFFAEGAQPGRGKRYVENCRGLIEGMRALGFEPLLRDELQAPIIVTFRMPADPAFRFQAFYDALKERGYVIYPGKLTVADSFRIGCIGRLYPDHMRGALAAIRDILDEMGVKSLKAAA